MTTSPRANFAQSVSAILERYCRQNALPPLLEAERGALAARLWVLVEVRGLPAPLAPSETGEPGEMSADEVTPLVARLLEHLERAEALSGPARQLVKACFQPEFKKCRGSYGEPEPDGTCRRQQLDRARGRVSGAHCVDCPYWTALTPEQHEKFLRREWRPERTAELAANREVFLPEDFRTLRMFLHAHARCSEGPGVFENRDSLADQTEISPRR